MGLKVNNTIAMTGEINLKGEVTAIGGLDAKVRGAKRAGVKLVLCPKENERDLQKILNGNDNPFDSSFKVKMVSNIWEVLKLTLMDKNVSLNKY